MVHVMCCVLHTFWHRFVSAIVVLNVVALATRHTAHTLDRISCNITARFLRWVAASTAKRSSRRTLAMNSPVGAPSFLLSIGRQERFRLSRMSHVACRMPHVSCCASLFHVACFMLHRSARALWLARNIVRNQTLTSVYVTHIHR